MSIHLKISQELYEEAFSVFTGAKENEFLIYPSYESYFVQYHGKSYRVAHFEDMMETYKGFMETSPVHIYTELPEELWLVILTEKIVMDAENFIINLYNAWKASWDESLFYGDVWSQFEHNKQQSELYLNQICYALRKSSKDIAQLLNLDPERFVPVIAKAIKDQYSKENEFYEEVVSLMTSRYHHQIGNGAEFSKVFLDEFGENEQIFFIYSVDDILG